MPFTLTYSRLQSLAQDDTVINEVEQTGSTILTGGFNSVTERKKLLCKFDIDETEDPDCQVSLTDAKLYVNWALFLPIGLALVHPSGAPTTGFSIDTTGLTPSAEAEAVEMPFYSLGNPIADSGKNFRCFFYYYASDSFGIELEFYNTFDEDGYANATPKSNEFRFLSEHYRELNTDIVSSSVFNTEKEIRVLTYIANQPIDTCTDGIGISEQQEHKIYQGTISKFANTLEILDETAVELTGLSHLVETSVIARFYSANDVDNFYAKLIRIQDDPDMNFIENYELSEAEIVDGETSYDPGAFVGPFSVDYNVEGYYDLGFYINPEFITEGAKYRIIIVAYNETEAKQGIGIETPAIGMPSYCGNAIECTDSYDFPTRLLFSPSLFDIDKEWTGNFLTCCIEERMRAQLIVDYSNNRWKNNLECRNGLTLGSSSFTNDIRKYLQYIELEFYEEYADANLGGTVRNILEKKLIQRIAVNSLTYTSYDSNLTFSFDGTAETLTLKYDYRNRNESSAPSLYSFLNGTPYLPVQGNQYWGGKTIFIKWRLSFYYHDITIPFIDNLDIIQKMVVKDYSNAVTITPDGNPTFFCVDEEFCFDASIILANPEDYYLINIFQWVGGGYIITESENFVPGELDQQEDDMFSSQDVDFTGGDASYCVDPSSLQMGIPYKFTAMAKKK